MRVTRTEKPKLHSVPRNRRAYPQLVADQALTRDQVLAARRADGAPKQQVILHAA
jgi:hypothetical protein